MIPQDVLSTAAVTAAFLPPRNSRRERLVDYELGGVALQDASEGLRVKVWTAQVQGDDVILSADGVEPTVVLTQSGISEIAFTFDQNMRPFVAYLLATGEAKFRWFDPQSNDFVTTDLPEGSYSPRCALDDKRRNAGIRTGLSDILLTYLREGKLYLRAQRDRYGVEYELATGYEDYVIGQFGMNRQFRMQWQLYKPVISS